MRRLLVTGWSCNSNVPAIRMTALSAGSRTSADADLEHLTCWCLERFQGSVSPAALLLSLEFCSTGGSSLCFSLGPAAITYKIHRELNSVKTYKCQFVKDKTFALKYINLLFEVSLRDVFLNSVAVLIYSWLLLSFIIWCKSSISL